MNALDLRQVERAAGVADQQSPGHFQLRHRLITALNDGAGAAGDDFSALEQALDRWMILPLLKSLDGLESRILVIQADHESGVDAIAVEGIEKTAAVSAAVQGPAEGVLNEARLDAARRQLPHFLEAQTVGLRRTIRIEF